MVLVNGDGRDGEHSLFFEETSLRTLLTLTFECLESLATLRAFLIDLLLVPENSDTKFSGLVLRT